MSFVDTGAFVEIKTSTLYKDLQKSVYSIEDKLIELKELYEEDYKKAKHKALNL